MIAVEKEDLTARLEIRLSPILKLRAKEVMEEGEISKYLREKLEEETTRRETELKKAS